MDKLKKGMYVTRILLFLIHFFLLFSIIGSLLQVKWLSIIFIIIYIIYVIKVITELLSKNKYYQEDIVYNIMQIGLFMYLFVMFYRIVISKAVVVKETLTYFKVNFGILSVLMIFILVYSFIELKLDSKK